jgi:hypothetical protein
MGLFNFTNITCLVFAFYAAIVANNFYHLFYPSECNSDLKSSCLVPVENWYEKYSVSCIRILSELILSVDLF